MSNEEEEHSNTNISTQNRIVGTRSLLSHNNDNDLSIGNSSLERSVTPDSIEDSRRSSEGENTSLFERLGFYGNK